MLELSVSEQVEKEDLMGKQLTPGKIVVTVVDYFILVFIFFP